MRTKVTNDLYQQIAEKRSAGETFTDIAKQHGLSVYIATRIYKSAPPTEIPLEATRRPRAATNEVGRSQHSIAITVRCKGFTQLQITTSDPELVRYLTFYSQLKQEGADYTFTDNLEQALVSLPGLLAYFDTWIENPA